MRVRAILLLLTAALLAGCAGPALQPGPDGIPPLAARDAWARARIEAVLQLYPFTPQAQQVIRAMDVRHMRGRPGWFGSNGYGKWLGIGAAKPASIVHELSHTLWGAFPVEGRPELTWTPGPNGAQSSASQALHADLRTFMQQPPDPYEPLRDYFRRLPELVSGVYPALDHGGEADLIYLTGGNLDLVPPILRKYYAPALSHGDFATWDAALDWYLQVPLSERPFIDQYFGIGRLPLDYYRQTVDPAARAPAGKVALVTSENRQRLADFAADYPLYGMAIGETPLKAQFHFWRDYLRDTLTLYQAYFDAFDGPGHTNAQLREAFQFLQDARARSAPERLSFVRTRLFEEKFLLGFVSTLDHQTLAALLASGGSARDAAVAEGVREALHPTHLLLLVEAALLARLDAVAAQQQFNGFVLALPARDIEDVNFTLDVLVTVQPELTTRILQGLSPEAAAFLLERDASHLRALLAPEDLIRVLGYGGQLNGPRLTALAKLLLKELPAPAYSSEPYVEALYQRVIRLGQTAPSEALGVFAEGALFLDTFLVQHPKEAATLFAALPQRAVEVLRTASPVREPGARTLSLLVRADPELAATLTVELERQRGPEAVWDVWAYMAYDTARLERQPGLPISLEREGLYFQYLEAQRGQPWVATALRETVSEYQGRIARGEFDPGFSAAFRRTLDAVGGTLQDAGFKQRFAAAVAAAF